MDAEALGETSKKYKHKHRDKRERKYKYRVEEEEEGNQRDGSKTGRSHGKRENAKRTVKNKKKVKEKIKEKKKSSKVHKKRKKGGDGSEERLRGKSKKKKKKKKVKEKKKGKTEAIPTGREHTLDLSTLTKDEVKALRKVIKKDEAEMRSMDMRVSVLRGEIEALRQSSADCIGPGSDCTSSYSRCPRCGKEFPAWHSVLPFLDRGVRCQACKYRVCKDCRYRQPNGLFLCRLCVCYRQEKLLTGEWMEASDGGVHSTDLIKLSLRDKEYFKKKRKKEEKKKAEQAKKLKGEIILEGFFGKKRQRQYKKKRSRDKAKKRSDGHSSHRGRKSHHRGAARGQRRSRKEKEKRKTRGKHEPCDGKPRRGGEGQVVCFEDELVVEGQDPDEFHNTDGNNFYGEDYFDDVEHVPDLYEYNYDGYYFDGEGEDDEDYYYYYDYYYDDDENEYDDSSQPEKGILEPEVCRGPMDSYCSGASLAPQNFDSLSGSRGLLNESKLQQINYMRESLVWGASGDSRLPCIDYLPMSNPPPYQERCPYTSVRLDTPGASVNPVPGLPAQPEHGDATLAPVNRKSKDRRKSLSLWKRIKLSLKETFRFVVPSLVRRDQNYSKKAPSDLDLDLGMETALNAVSAEKIDQDKAFLRLDDVNWNFQPTGGGPQHGGGRIGVGRPSRGRGGGRGRGRGRGGRGMRGRGRGMHMRGRGGRGAWRGPPPRGPRAGGRGGGGGGGGGGRSDRKDKDKDRESKEKKSKKKKKDKKKKEKKSTDDMSEAIGDLQKRLKGDHGGVRGSRSSSQAEKRPSDMNEMYYCPPKETEDIASQTSKPRRSKFMEFFCPFCRFNVEWA
ncbi:synaptotagmin-like protein 5 [Elysia marginata]|uniref:Synaptotagmin-like protein 5 n=1 Tax=Elysia marginata TaxID=1093978 RepID=A0AAV4HT71_9GAST|nr:synaptotagmin-like protein 5 [Elysia marginata]